MLVYTLQPAIEPKVMAPSEGTPSGERNAALRVGAVLGPEAVSVGAQKTT